MLIVFLYSLADIAQADICDQIFPPDENFQKPFENARVYCKDARALVIGQPSDDIYAEIFDRAKNSTCNELIENPLQEILCRATEFALNGGACSQLQPADFPSLIGYPRAWS